MHTDNSAIDDDCIVCLLLKHVESHPERSVFTCGDRSLSFAVLWEQAGSVANALAERGLVPGDIVSSMSYNSTECFVYLIAALRSGLIYSPINVSLQADDLAETLELVRPKIFLICGGLYGKIAGESILCTTAVLSASNISNSPRLFSAQSIVK